MIILGIDPATHRLGWGVLQIGARAVGNPAGWRHLASGTVVAPRQELLDRLLHMVDAVEAIIERHRPTAVALEAVFVARHAQSALALGAMRGALLVALARRRFAPATYSPSQVKQAVSGSGRASKDQVFEMVQRLLAIRLPPASFDASDALAVALCHAQTAQSAAWQQRLQAAAR